MKLSEILFCIYALAALSMPVGLVYTALHAPHSKPPEILHGYRAPAKVEAAARHRENGFKLSEREQELLIEWLEKH